MMTGTTWGLTVLLALTASDAGSLKLTHFRTTYGPHGPARTDARFLPGDQLILSFDVEGAQLGNDGNAQYSIAMDVLNRNGKLLFRQEPQNLETGPASGSSGHFPAAASLQIGLDQPAGNYTLKVTVTDRRNGAQQTLTRDYEVLPPAFGIVRLSATADTDGKIPALVPRQGQPIYLNFAVVGFAREEGKGPPQLAVNLRVTDAEGQPVFATPLSGQVREGIAPLARAIPMQFRINPDRAGEFKVQLTIKDQQGNQEKTLAAPLRVLARR